MKYLIVIDMQNDFITGTLKNEEAIKILPNVKAKIKTFINEDKNDRNLLFTLDLHSQNYMQTHEGKYLPVKHCISGTNGSALHNEINEAFQGFSADFVTKNTFGSLDWDVFLGELTQEDSIELVGVCTDICVVSNALILRAFYPEAEIFVDASCCAGTSVKKHKAALEVMKSCHINVYNDK